MNMKTLARQCFLKLRGFYSGKLDGEDGPLTSKAQSLFETAWNRVGTGVVDVSTPIPKEDPEDTLDPLWLRIARGEIGEKEIVGSKHNHRVLEYHDATDLDASTDEVAWCSSFVNWCMLKANIARTKSAAARSWLNWGTKLDAPKLGAVVVFQRGNSSWQGHVAFVVGWDASYVKVLGGNQSNAVTIANYKRATVLGYRWPA